MAHSLAANGSVALERGFHEHSDLVLTGCQTHGLLALPLSEDLRAQTERSAAPRSATVGRLCRLFRLLPTAL